MSRNEKLTTSLEQDILMTTLSRIESQLNTKGLTQRGTIQSRLLTHHQENNKQYDTPQTLPSSSFLSSTLNTYRGSDPKQSNPFETRQLIERELGPIISSVKTDCQATLSTIRQEIKDFNRAQGDLKSYQDALSSNRTLTSKLENDTKIYYEQINNKFNQIDLSIEDIKERFSEVNRKVSQMTNEMKYHNDQRTSLAVLEGKVEGLDRRINQSDIERNVEARVMNLVTGSMMEMQRGLDYKTAQMTRDKERLEEEREMMYKDSIKTSNAVFQLGQDVKMINEKINHITNANDGYCSEIIKLNNSLKQQEFEMKKQGDSSYLIGGIEEKIMSQVNGRMMEMQRNYERKIEQMKLDYEVKSEQQRNMMQMKMESMGNSTNNNSNGSNVLILQNNQRIIEENRTLSNNINDINQKMMRIAKENEDNKNEIERLKEICRQNEEGLHKQTEDINYLTTDVRLMKETETIQMQHPQVIATIEEDHLHNNNNNETQINTIEINQIKAEIQAETELKTQAKSKETMLYIDNKIEGINKTMHSNIEEIYSRLNQIEQTNQLPVIIPPQITSPSEAIIPPELNEKILSLTQQTSTLQTQMTQLSTQHSLLNSKLTDINHITMNHQHKEIVEQDGHYAQLNTNLISFQGVFDKYIQEQIKLNDMYEKSLVVCTNHITLLDKNTKSLQEESEVNDENFIRIEENFNKMKPVIDVYPKMKRDFAIFAEIIKTMSKNYEELRNEVNNNFGSMTQWQGELVANINKAVNELKEDYNEKFRNSTSLMQTKTNEIEPNTQQQSKEYNDLSELLKTLADNYQDLKDEVDANFSCLNQWQINLIANISKAATELRTDFKDKCLENPVNTESTGIIPRKSITNTEDKDNTNRTNGIDQPNIWLSMNQDFNSLIEVVKYLIQNYIDLKSQVNGNFNALTAWQTELLANISKGINDLKQDYENKLRQSNGGNANQMNKSNDIKIQHEDIAKSIESLAIASDQKYVAKTELEILKSQIGDLEKKYNTDRQNIYYSQDVNSNNKGFNSPLGGGAIDLKNNYQSNSLNENFPAQFMQAKNNQEMDFDNNNIFFKDKDWDFE